MDESVCGDKFDAVRYSPRPRLMSERSVPSAAARLESQVSVGSPLATAIPPSCDELARGQK